MSFLQRGNKVIGFAEINLVPQACHGNSPIKSTYFASVWKSVGQTYCIKMGGSPANWKGFSVEVFTEDGYGGYCLCRLVNF